MFKCNCIGIKPVFVRAYIRVRYGRIENVSQYCRSLPYQGSRYRQYD